MGFIFADRVKDTSTTTGTGTYTLSGTAPTGFQSFGTGIGNANTCYYVATDSIDWEVGLGTYTAAGTTLARTLIIASTNSNNAVSWSAGTRTLWVDIPASAMTNLAAPITQTNGAFAASVGSSALTIALKGTDGNDPSPRNPVVVPFRSATAATGTPSYLTVTAATSLVISSGSTMGFTSAVAGRLWIVGFNDAGTFRLGAVNALSGTSIMALRNGIYSSTAEGGAGGADSAQVIYTGTAVTSKGMTILGYLEATEATAGTWATAPSVIQIMEPGISLPGDTVQAPSTSFSTVASGTTQIPSDNTIPQSGEGDQYATQAIVPTSATNLLKVEFTGSMSNNGANYLLCTALFQDSVANALAVAFQIASNLGTSLPLRHVILAATTSSTTFKIRAGADVSGTTTFGGQGGSRKYGAIPFAWLTVTEIMA